MRQVVLPLAIGRLPPWPYKFYNSPVPEYILGIDMISPLCMQTTMGKFLLRIRMVKAVLQGHACYLPMVLPVPHRVVAVKQYQLPGGHKEIGETVQELAKVKIICPAHSPYHVVVWPVQ